MKLVLIKSNISDRLWDFFKDNKSKDKAIHQFAKDNGMEPSKVEGEIYKMLSAFTAGGRYNDTQISIDKKELALGIKIEMEHLDKSNPYSKYIAKRIAMDHIAEFPKYYSEGLLKMEKRLKGGIK